MRRPETLEEAEAVAAQEQRREVAVLEREVPRTGHLRSLAGILRARGRADGWASCRDVHVLRAAADAGDQEAAARLMELRAVEKRRERRGRRR